MSIIIRLQNLPWSANAADIRQFFHSLVIPEGGVHIVGGENGDAFIAFGSDEDARQAMLLDGGKIKEVIIKLLLSSRTEMQKVIETARIQALSMQNIMQLTAASASAMAQVGSVPQTGTGLSTMVSQLLLPSQGTLLQQQSLRIPQTLQQPGGQHLIHSSGAQQQIIQGQLHLPEHSMQPTNMQQMLHANPMQSQMMQMQNVSGIQQLMQLNAGSQNMQGCTLPPVSSADPQTMQGARFSTVHLTGSHISHTSGQHGVPSMDQHGLTAMGQQTIHSTGHLINSTGQQLMQPTGQQVINSTGQNLLQSQHVMPNIGHQSMQNVGQQATQNVAQHAMQHGVQSIPGTGHLSLQNVGQQTMQHGGQGMQHGGQAMQHGGQAMQHGGQAMHHVGQTMQHGGQTMQHGGQTMQHGGQAMQQHSGQTGNQSMQQSGQTIQQSGQSIQQAGQQSIQHGGQGMHIVGQQQVMQSVGQNMIHRSGLQSMQNSSQQITPSTGVQALQSPGVLPPPSTTTVTNAGSDLKNLTPTCKASLVSHTSDKESSRFNKDIRRGEREIDKESSSKHHSTSRSPESRMRSHSRDRRSHRDRYKYRDRSRDRKRRKDRSRSKDHEKNADDRDKRSRSRDRSYRRSRSRDRKSRDSSNKEKDSKKESEKRRDEWYKDRNIEKKSPKEDVSTKNSITLDPRFKPIPESSNKANSETEGISEPTPMDIQDDNKDQENRMSFKMSFHPRPISNTASHVKTTQGNKMSAPQTSANDAEKKSDNQESNNKPSTGPSDPRLNQVPTSTQAVSSDNTNSNQRNMQEDASNVPAISTSMQYGQMYKYPSANGNVPPIPMPPHMPPGIPPPYFPNLVPPSGMTQPFNTYSMYMGQYPNMQIRPPVPEFPNRMLTPKNTEPVSSSMLPEFNQLTRQLPSSFNQNRNPPNRYSSQAPNSEYSNKQYNYGSFQTQINSNSYNSHPPNSEHHSVIDNKSLSQPRSDSTLANYPSLAKLGFLNEKRSEKTDQFSDQMSEKITRGSVVGNETLRDAYSSRIDNEQFKKRKFGNEGFIPNSNMLPFPRSSRFTSNISNDEVHSDDNDVYDNDHSEIPHKNRNDIRQSSQMRNVQNDKSFGPNNYMSSDNSILSRQRGPNSYNRTDMENKNYDGKPRFPPGRPNSDPRLNKPHNSSDGNSFPKYPTMRGDGIQDKYGEKNYGPEKQNADTYPPNCCVEVRKLLLTTSGNDLRKFFDPHYILNICFPINNRGDRMGMAYVRFSTRIGKLEALKRNRCILKNKPVEVIDLNDNKYNDYIASEIPVGIYLKMNHIPITATPDDIKNMMNENDKPSNLVFVRNNDTTWTIFMKFLNERICKRVLGNKYRYSLFGKPVLIEICTEDEYVAALKNSTDLDQIRSNTFSNSQKELKNVTGNENTQINKSVEPETDSSEQTQKQEKNEPVSDKLTSNKNQLPINETKNVSETKSKNDKDDKNNEVGRIETDCILVKGLPKEASTDQDLLKIFDTVGLIPTQIHIMFDSDCKPVGDAYCEFNSNIDATIALTKDKTKYLTNVISVEPVSREDMMRVIGSPIQPNTFMKQTTDVNRKQPPPRPVFPGIKKGMGPEKIQDFVPSRRNPPPRPNEFGKGMSPDKMHDFVPSRRNPPPGPDEFGRPGCVVGLENVPYAASVEEIMELFGPVVRIRRTDIIRRFNDSGKPTGDARVRLETPRDAEKAVRLLNNTFIRSRRLNIFLVR